MRFLFVCRHFPPAVSGGARRPFLLARALRDLGHEVCVLAPQPCDGVNVVVVPHPAIDPSDGPPGSPVRAAMRACLLPDPDIRWALRAASAYAGPAPDWVFTTSPPESAHVAGWLLKRRFGCRWVADFRDHWLEAPLIAARRHPLRRLVEKAIAAFLLRRSDRAVAVGPQIARELHEICVSSSPGVLANFADPPVGLAALDPKLRHVVHTGSFMLSDPARRLEPVLAALAACPDRSVRLHLAGRLSSAELALVENSPDAERIVVHGVVPMVQARRLQAAADRLLLVVSPGSPHVPGKLAEYRAAGRPIVAVGEGPWSKLAELTPVSAAAVFDFGKTTPEPIMPGIDPSAAVASFLAVLEGN